MLASGREELVRDGEGVVRFIRFSNQYRKDNLRPKAALFEPPSNAVVLSVTRSDGLADETIEAIGWDVVAQAGNKLHGWCKLIAADIRAIKNMDVEADEANGKLHHAHIIGFPNNKEDLLEIRQELAEKAEDVVRV